MTGFNVELRNNKADEVMTKTLTLVLRETAKLQNCELVTKPKHPIDATLKDLSIYYGPYYAIEFSSS